MTTREETIKQLEEKGIKVVPQETIRKMFRSLGIEPDDRPVTDEELEESRRILSKSKTPLSEMMLRKRGER
ncbi:MAG: hypothetical protein HYW25_06235 [Candidatus Aenigmarchaeota archaeon]|nr:hypothetical protein [Candidatus Aenigmarchaeota archaeon]